MCSTLFLVRKSGQKEPGAIRFFGESSEFSGTRFALKILRRSFFLNCSGSRKKNQKRNPLSRPTSFLLPGLVATCLPFADHSHCWFTSGWWPLFRTVWNVPVLLCLGLRLSVACSWPSSERRSGRGYPWMLLVFYQLFRFFFVSISIESFQKSIC